jgi:hypothetical protein
LIVKASREAQVEIRALGGAADSRESERIEREVLHLVTADPQITVAKIELSEEGSR